MGCLRLGFALLGSFILAAILTVVGAVIGTIAYLYFTPELRSPLDALGGPHSTGLLGGGGIGAFLGLCIMVALIRRAMNINWLKAQGTRIRATVTDVRKQRESSQVSYRAGNQTMYRTDWRTYYVIEARWLNPQSNQWQTFTSHKLYRNPRRYLKGGLISVLIDPQNVKKYIVEV